MSEKFDGKVFVTSAAKAQAVRNLLEYWTMKTELLKKKTDPTVFGNKEVQQKTKDYLVKNTKLKEKAFFSTLSQENQEKATKCFTMQEVPQAKKEIIAKSRLKAVVYICLSGFAVVKNMKTDTEVRYGAGEVFGSLDHFHKVVVNGEEMIENHPDDQGPPSELINFGEGTFVRMELNELYNTVLKPDPEDVAAIEEIKQQEAAVQISGIAWEKMSEDDKFYVRVYKRTKELVNKRFFSFLDSYRMIPKNATMAAYRYYNEGNKGRDVYLDRRDQTWVFVIIDGSVKVELCATKHNGTNHTISYVRKSEENSMHIKKKTMPLLLLSAGSVLCIHPECFALADEEEAEDDDYESIVSKNHTNSPSDGRAHSPKDKVKPLAKFRSRFPPSRNNTARSAVGGGRGGAHMSRMSSSASVDSSASGRTAQTSNTFHSVGSSIDSHIHRKSDRFEPHSTPPDIKDAQYHIKLSFEATTSYLAVPYNNFARILDDNRLVLPKIAKEIKWYLQSPSDQIKERISRLLPWVQGNIDFNQRQSSVKALDVLDFLPAELGPRTDELVAPLGSFAATANVRGDSTSEFKPATPKLAPPAPSMSQRGIPSTFSAKVAPQRNTEQDQTMNSMLLELRKSRESQKGKGATMKTPTRASMFMTQDMEERDFSIVEESVHDADSDSDIDVNDFRPKKSLNGGFSDSFDPMDAAGSIGSLRVRMPSLAADQSDADSIEVPLTVPVEPRISARRKGSGDSKKSDGLAIIDGGVDLLSLSSS